MATQLGNSAEERQRNADRLVNLLNVDGNGQCADCGAISPKWASWTLGVFICLHCSGIHRNILGHTSKLKSLTLDFWTTAEVDNMEEIGNIKANKLYEASLPKDFQRPQQNNALMMEFIRNKYEFKKYKSPPVLWETTTPIGNEETTTPTGYEDNTSRLNTIHGKDIENDPKKVSEEDINNGPKIVSEEETGCLCMNSCSCNVL
ncbi:stromal membrane-associated protein 2-like [Pecten maximus]|uniref:stromal membrane-associated protein 2-like n=1 Tax=Pecten maximus TaxID=6579 RepID=UPI001458E2BD|nr:stromal membrane-associated protein 2-like [Pecten maximus]